MLNVYAIHAVLLLTSIIKNILGHLVSSEYISGSADIF
jgi:hypothetical protein